MGVSCRRDFNPMPGAQLLQRTGESFRAREFDGQLGEEVGPPRRRGDEADMDTPSEGRQHEGTADLPGEAFFEIAMGSGAS